MDKIIDQAWISLLANAMNKQEKMRPEIGDTIDLYLTQSRLLSLASKYTDSPTLLYQTAQASARRNTTVIVRKLGMPTDYFWKFDYWPRSRAMSTLGQLVKRVFASMMTQAKEGNMTIVQLEIEPLRITIDFEDCVECAGIEGATQGLCYYHAGTFSGILSGLINQELDAYETACQATGNNYCSFVVGAKEDTYIKDGNSNYLSHSEVSTDLVARLDKTLQNQSVRPFGDQVNVNYHRLAIANALSADPERLAINHFQAGSEFGRKLASKLAGFYGENELDNMSKYYSRLGELRIEMEGNQVLLELVLTECTESIGPDKPMEMMSFLFGELQGLTSEIIKKEMRVRESHFDGERLHLTLSSQS